MPNNNVFLLKLAVAASVATIKSNTVNGEKGRYCNTYFDENLAGIVVDEESCNRHCLQSQRGSMFTEYDDFFYCQCKGCFGFVSALRYDDVQPWSENGYNGTIPNELLHTNFGIQPPEIVHCIDIPDVIVKDQDSCLDWCGEFTFSMYVPGPGYARCVCFVPTGDEDLSLHYDFEKESLAGGLEVFKMCVDRPHKEGFNSEIPPRCPEKIPTSNFHDSYGCWEYCRYGKVGGGRYRCEPSHKNYPISDIRSILSIRCVDLPENVVEIFKSAGCDVRCIEFINITWRHDYGRSRGWCECLDYDGGRNVKVSEIPVCPNNTNTNTNSDDDTDDDNQSNVDRSVVPYNRFRTIFRLILMFLFASVVPSCS